MLGSNAFNNCKPGSENKMAENEGHRVAVVIAQLAHFQPLLTLVTTHIITKFLSFV